jgi:dynein intermediate chain
MMQQRRDEILAKKAKLAELKRQRELRTSSATHNRASIGNTSEVRIGLNIIFFNSCPNAQ